MSSKFGLFALAGVLICTSGAALTPASAAENYAPLWVENDGPEPLPDYTRGAGPVFEQRAGETELSAVRPLWVNFYNTSTGTSNSHSFYPLFNLWQKEGSYQWDIYNLIRGGRTEVPGREDVGRFEVWPFFWHYDSGDPETSYNALFPVLGTLKNRLFYKRIDWVMFPFYLRLEKRDYVDTAVLWPIFRSRKGPNDGGWAVWPLYGHFYGEGRYDNRFALWPILYDNRKLAGDGTVISRSTGALPIWARQTAPGMESETYLWPFFGYTVETDPRPEYRETRYLYPFIVQGRGEEKFVNRLLPFYAHETKPGYEKHWYAWPLLKTERQQLGPVLQETQRVLFFLWRNVEQTVPGRDDFHARKTSLWPLFSYWDNGNGTRQMQALSPLEPFFPGNRAVQQTWSPFFALYRFEGQDDASRHSLLWDLIYLERSDIGHEFSLGPLYEQESGPEGARWSLLKGLLTLQKPEEGGMDLSGLWGLLD